MQVRLNINSSDSATLQLYDKPAEKITEMHLEWVGFTGASRGARAMITSKVPIPMR